MAEIQMLDPRPLHGRSADAADCAPTISHENARKAAPRAASCEKSGEERRRFLSLLGGLGLGSLLPGCGGIELPESDAVTHTPSAPSTPPLKDPLPTIEDPEPNGGSSGDGVDGGDGMVDAPNPPKPPQQEPEPVEPIGPESYDELDPYLVLNRLTFGAQREDAEYAKKIGLKAWIEEQLAPERLDDSELDARLALLPTLWAPIPGDGKGHKESGKNMGMMMDGDSSFADDLQFARLLRAAASRRQLFERMVEFWTDHFNIFIRAKGLGAHKAMHDREVVRVHAMGRFPDLLRATAKSSAMLHYLDNDANVAGVTNENLARELMELHTLSPRSGYTQEDVEALGRCLTGWSFEKTGDDAGAFRFIPRNHDAEAKQFLGASQPAGGGEADGEWAMDLILAHPALPEFLAEKLCRFFIAYDPPAWLVSRVANAYRETDGEIRAMLREVLSPRSLGALSPKLRRPFDLACAALRAIGAEVDSMTGLKRPLQELGQMPFEWPAPNGYPDHFDTWAGFLRSRWSFAALLAQNKMKGVAHRLHQEWFSRAEKYQNDPVAFCADRLTSGTVTSGEQDAMRSALTALIAPDDSKRLETAAALTLSSPAFQWH